MQPIEIVVLLFYNSAISTFPPTSISFMTQSYPLQWFCPPHHSTVYASLLIKPLTNQTYQNTQPETLYRIQNCNKDIEMMIDDGVHVSVVTVVVVASSLSSVVHCPIFILHETILVNTTIPPVQSWGSMNS